MYIHTCMHACIHTYYIHTYALPAPPPPAKDKEPSVGGLGFECVLFSSLGA